MIQISPKLTIDELKSTDQQISILYRLLQNRQYKISHHELPGFEDHAQFVKNNPYRIWFLVYYSNDAIGSFYLNQDNSIGINLQEYKKEILFLILDYVFSNFKPLDPVKSVRSGFFTVNVSPENNEFKLLLERYGMEAKQITYQMPISKKELPSIGRESKSRYAEHILNVLKKTLVVIPARGGSKRIPNKNMKAICGKSMVLWPIGELSKGFNLDQILVSTDSVAIKKLVENVGLKVPFLRPAELADDFTGTTEVVQHALDLYERDVKTVDYVLAVYPTAVTLQFSDIVKAIEMMLHQDVGCVLSAAEYSTPIQRAYTLNESDELCMKNPDEFSTRSQDLQPSYHDIGQFYFFRSDVLRNKILFNQIQKKMVKIDRKYVIDIDTQEDLEYAELKLKILKAEES